MFNINTLFQLKLIANIQTLLLAVLVAATLSFSTFFIYASLTPFFLYCIGAGLFTLFAGIVFLSGHIKTINSLGIMTLTVIMLWAAYIAFHNRLLHTDSSLKQIYLLVCCILFAAAMFTFSSSFTKFRSLFILMVMLAGFESLFCLLQYAGIIPSLNSFFTVTGTWTNPNVTAMFLAMTFPSLLYCIINFNTASRKRYIFLLCLVTLAVFLLKCRTAIIGAGIVSAFILQHHYNIIQLFRKRFSPIVRSAILLTLLAFIFFLSFFGYNAKKESAEGRQLIWKLSAGMIGNKPSGYGYGSFERNYNLAQASYFEAGKGTDEEKINASQALMAYNEYLENIIEGGVIGLVLFAAFMTVLLYGGVRMLYRPVKGVVPINTAVVKSSKKQKPVQKVMQEHTITPAAVAYSGVLAFAVMSLINFTFTAIPVMCIFLLLAAILIADGINLPVFKQVRFGFAWQKALGIIFIISGCLFVYLAINNAIAHHEVKSANELAKKGDIKKGIDLLQQQPASVRHTESYCRILGKLFLKDKRYDSALLSFQRAALFTSSPDLYMQIGLCEQALQRYSDAIHSYRTALFIQPALFGPRYALLQLHLQQKDSVNAIETASEIIQLIPKVESPEIGRYKQMAGQVLLHFKKTI